MVEETPGTPESPRDWDSDHRTLRELGPHETAGVVRSQRTGRPPHVLRRDLGIRGTALMRSIELGLNEEALAAMRGRQIHDSLVNLTDDD